MFLIFIEHELNTCLTLCRHGTMYQFVFASTSEVFVTLMSHPALHYCNLFNRLFGKRVLFCQGDFLINITRNFLEPIGCLTELS